MGTVPSNPQFQATNYVLDFSINLLYPNAMGQVMERIGPNIGSFPQQGKNQVLIDFNQCLNTANPQFIVDYNKSRSWSCLFIIITFIGFPAGIVTLMLFSRIMGIAVIVAAVIFGFGGLLVMGGKQREISRRWREEVLVKLHNKLSIWQGMYPAFTFTIIYPVEVWRRRNKKRRLVAIWCYVRVTQGPCQTGIGYNQYFILSVICSHTGFENI